MSAVKPLHRCTVEEYLALERAAEERSQYIDGEIYTMAGESLAHSTISANLIGVLHQHLRGQPCRVLTPNMKIRSGPVPAGRMSAQGMYSYPDASVVCGQPLFHDEHRDVLLNPTVLFEVLSPATESFDRGEKFRRYRTHLETLTDYVLIAQDRPVVDWFHRQDGGGWLLRGVEGLDAVLELPEIGCMLSLAELYDRVEFPVVEAAPAEGEEAR